jgi:hypothetical protein
VSSANPSPHPTQSAKVGDGEQPLLRKHQSFTSLRDAQAHTPSEEKGFAKFLAAKKADWRGERKVDEAPTSQAGLELGPGKEVERNGGGRWRHFELHENGEGLGVVDDAVEVCLFSSHRISLTIQIFTYDGTSLRVKGTITLDDGIVAQSTFFSRSYDHIGIVTKVCLVELQKWAYIQDNVIIYDAKSSAASENIS